MHRRNKPRKVKFSSCCYLDQFKGRKSNTMKEAGRRKLREQAQLTSELEYVKLNKVR